MAVLVALTAALTGLLVGAAPAAAAPLSSTPLTPDGTTKADRHVTHVTTTLTRKVSTDAPYLTQDVIYCAGTISTPVVQDVPGFLPNTTVNAFCDQPVDSISVRAIMLFNGQVFSQVPGGSVGSASATATAEGPCQAIPNSYQGFGDAVFTKAGYVGSPLYLFGYSPVVRGTC